MNRSATVAIVGRPNVGKSTLFNRLTHSRRAIVGNEPGITRDRIYGPVEWRGRRFQVVDTGGVLPDEAQGIPQAIFRQARAAIAHSAAILFVVDGRTPLAAPDMQLARLLQKTGKPILLAVNKADSDRQAEESASYYELGITPVFPISAEHGRGVDDMLDYLLPLLPAGPDGHVEAPPAEKSAAEAAQSEAETRIAIIGRPNVGKSTLLNRITGEERAIVSEIAGTTRDAVDAAVERDGAHFRFIDTAGIRRKGKTRLMAEKLSVVMARQHLARADLALVLLDAIEGLVSLDTTIAGYASEGGKSCILVVNKWDVARERKLKRSDFEAEIRRTFKFLSYAPIVFISAERGEGIDSLFKVITKVARERRKRIPTAEINRFLASVDFERVPVPVSRRVKIYYMSQVGVAPPAFILFIDRPRELHFSYERYLENQIRRAFGFTGTPIVLKTRVSR